MKEPIIASGMRNAVSRISMSPTASAPRERLMPRLGITAIPTSAGANDPSVQPGKAPANASATAKTNSEATVAIHFESRAGPNAIPAAASSGRTKRREVRVESIGRSVGSESQCEKRMIWIMFLIVYAPCIQIQKTHATISAIPPAIVAA